MIANWKLRDMSDVRRKAICIRGTCSKPYSVASPPHHQAIKFLQRMMALQAALMISISCSASLLLECYAASDKFRTMDRDKLTEEHIFQRQELQRHVSRQPLLGSSRDKCVKYYLQVSFTAPITSSFLLSLSLFINHGILSHHDHYAMIDTIQHQPLSHRTSNRGDSVPPYTLDM